MGIFAFLRLAIYGLALTAAGKGLIDFDLTSGLIDIRPFTIDSAMQGFSGFANGIAALALIKGWSGKKRVN